MTDTNSWIGRLFNQHKLVRRLLVLWAICLITTVTFKVFNNISEITPAVSAALGTITALLTVVVGLYQWSRTREDKDV